MLLKRFDLLGVWRCIVNSVYSFANIPPRCIDASSTEFDLFSQFVAQIVPDHGGYVLAERHRT